MRGIFNSLCKRKLSNMLLVIQIALALLYFFASAASLQAAFYTNIRILEVMDVPTSEIVHLEVQHDEWGLKEQNFKRFCRNLEETGIVQAVTTYRNTDVYSETFGSGVNPALEICLGMNRLKKFQVAEGRNLREEDFDKRGTRKEPIPIVIGQELAKDGLLEMGSLVCNSDDIWYEVIGILAEDDMWFFQNIADGIFLSLDNQIVVPTSDIGFDMNYYCILPDDKSEEEVLSEMRKEADKQGLIIEVNVLSEKMKGIFDETLSENRKWLIFSVIILVMISIGTATIIIARMYSRKQEIGIRMAVGYSMKQIYLMLLGEITILGLLAFGVAVVGANMLVGKGIMDMSGMIVFTGYYLSHELILLGGFITIMMCFPSIIALYVSFCKLQPKDLIGGKE